MIRCIRVLSIEDWSYLALLDHLLRHTFFPRILYLRFTTRGKKGLLTMTGDLSACKSKRTLIQLLTVNKPLFLALLPGNKWSRFDLLLLFVIFNFLLVFLFASTNFWSSLLTQNLHLAPSTQQAEQAGFTREEITRRASQFSLKINKRQSS
jgi:hypothetical protein